MFSISVSLVQLKQVLVVCEAVEIFRSLSILGSCIMQFLSLVEMFSLTPIAFDT